MNCEMSVVGCEMYVRAMCGKWAQYRRNELWDGCGWL